MSYGDDITGPRQRKDKDRNSHYQNSFGRYKCIQVVPSRIAHGLMRAGLFVVKNSTTILLITALEMVNFSVNIIIYTVTSKQYRQEYSKLLSSCFCCFNACRRSTKANDTCHRSTNASHTGHI